MLSRLQLFGEIKYGFHKCDLNVKFRKKISEYFIGVYVHEKYVSVGYMFFYIFASSLCCCFCYAKAIYFKPPDIYS